MKDRRGPATVTEKKPAARTTRQPLAQRLGRRDENTRKPGDLPPIPPSSPRGKGFKDASQSQSDVPSRSALHCCPLSRFPAAAGATSSQTEIDAAVDKAVDYVRLQQDVATGAFPGFGGDWSATSLAAAGVSSADVHGPRASDPSLQDYLLGEYTEPSWDEDPPGGPRVDYARAILVAHAAGLDPARLSASSNQPAQLAGRWNPAIGSFGEASTNNTAFGLLAMKTAGLPGWALEPLVSFLRRNQHDDGGWNFPAALTPAARAEASDPEMTGAAIAALCEAGAPAYDPDVAAGLGFLRARLIDATGGDRLPVRRQRRH